MCAVYLIFGTFDIIYHEMSCDRKILLSNWLQLPKIYKKYVIRFIDVVLLILTEKYIFFLIEVKISPPLLPLLSLSLLFLPLTFPISPTRTSHFPSPSHPHFPTPSPLAFPTCHHLPSQGESTTDGRTPDRNRVSYPKL